jgi:hypothetical protein
LLFDFFERCPNLFPILQIFFNRFVF